MATACTSLSCGYEIYDLPPSPLTNTDDKGKAPPGQLIDAHSLYQPELRGYKLYDLPPSPLTNTDDKGKAPPGQLIDAHSL